MSLRHPSSGTLIGGEDFLAVDATAARVMGFEPANIGILAFMGWAGLGQIETNKIRLVGTPLEELRRSYEPAPQV